MAAEACACVLACVCLLACVCVSCGRCLGCERAILLGHDLGTGWIRLSRVVTHTIRLIHMIEDRGIV